MPGLTGQTVAERRQQAEVWCERFAANSQTWLKTTVADYETGSRDVRLSYEEVDTSLIPPRPRLYGLVGAEVIEEVWQERISRSATAAERMSAPAVARGS